MRIANSAVSSNLPLMGLAAVHGHPVICSVVNHAVLGQRWHHLEQAVGNAVPMQARVGRRRRGFGGRSVWRSGFPRQFIRGLMAR